jgi:hypothetical protein
LGVENFQTPAEVETVHEIILEKLKLLRQWPRRAGIRRPTGREEKQSSAN